DEDRRAHRARIDHRADEAVERARRARSDRAREADVAGRRADAARVDVDGLAVRALRSWLTAFVLDRGRALVAPPGPPCPPWLRGAGHSAVLLHGACDGDGH